MGRKTGVKGRDSCVFPFHNTVSANAASGLISFILSPNATVSPRSLIEADTWAHFRVRNFMFRLHPASTQASNNSQAAGYIGGVQDGTPNSFAQVAELLPSTILGADSTCPTEWVRVGRSDLADPLPWYKTIPGTADATEESPGALVVATSNSSSDLVVLEMRGVFEFKTAVNAANTPQAMAAYGKLREERLRTVVEAQRELLLRILAVPASGGKPLALSSANKTG